jgi:hypothetical protein
MKYKITDKKTYSALQIVYRKIPAIRPFMRYIYQKFFNIELSPKLKFSGWGITSEHELPWVDRYNWNTFRQSAQDIKKYFEFRSSNEVGDIDRLLWRHWIVSFSIRYAIEFNKDKSNKLNLVELGVADGITAFFALREMQDYKKHNENVKYSMHLYDSWKPMREKELLKTELSVLGKYSNLSLVRTKKNLSEFKDNIIYHQGYIPESLNVLSPPDSIIYMHIDLNSAIPTLAALEFFYPRMTKGGVILFDDYGWTGHEDTKEVVDTFFANKAGILMKLPTGQAIYFV